MAFTGFPPSAFDFYERLAADNSRTFWLANKEVYDRDVKGSMVALLDDLAEFGPFHLFRPNRDVRFAKDKTPYKEHTGAVGESEGGASYYVHFGAASLYAGSGYYHMASDQLERFRAAVDADKTGAELADLCTAAHGAGMQTGAIGELKTAPRGYPKDHPRVELLRRKGLHVGKEWPRAKWMSTKAVVERVRGVWRDADDINQWLDAHVGPSTLAPEDAQRR